MSGYKKKAIFHLPGAFEQVKLYQFWFNFFNKNPHYLKDNVIIGSVYGSPGHAIWNGGRFIGGGLIMRGELENVRDFYNSQNIPVRFTFSNSLIEEKHTYDTYCNNVLDLYANGKNEILCNSSILDKYLRNKYVDKYKYISSTTKRIQQQDEQLKEINKDYYLTVIDYDFNKNFDFLKTIENKNKCEILCNAVCISNCPNRKQHYESISYCQLNHCPEQLINCPFQKRMFWEVKKSNNFVSVDDINHYLDMGFNNFKLEGRILPLLELIEILLYYLVKEEYIEEVRIRIHSAMQ